MTIEEITSQKLRETIYTTVIPPDLRVFVWRKPGFNKKYALFATHYGSIDNKFALAGEGPSPVPAGIAHFLEHKLFEKEDGDVFNKFAALGAFANAYTTYDLTAYLFSCTSDFEGNLEILLDFVQEPYFTTATVEKEQGIIEQELRMYADEPEHLVFQNLMEAMYCENPVRIDIGGTVESIHEIDKDLLYRCYHTFYQPANMALVVVGDVEPSQVVELVAANVAGHQHASSREIIRVQPDEAAGPREKSVSGHLEIARPRLLLGFKDSVGATGQDLLRRELATSLMWRIVLGRSSPLYNALYDQGLIDERFSASYSSAPTYAFSVVGGETDNPEQLQSEISNGLKHLVKEGLPQADLERARRALIGHFLEAFNSQEYIAGSLASHYFRGTSLFDYITLVEDVTNEELQGRLAEYANPDNAVVSLLYPQKGR